MARVMTKVDCVLRLAELKTAVKALLPLTGKVSIPILKHFLVSPNGTSATVASCDLDVMLSAEVPATWATDEPFTVDAEMLSKFADVWPNEPMAFASSPKPEFIGVTCPQMAGTVYTYPVSEWPPTAVGKLPVVGRVSGSELARLAASVHKAITSEDTRYFLNGGQMALGAGSARLVATDGHRMHIVTCPAQAKDSIDLIVSRRTLNVLRTLASGAAEVVVSADERHIRFQMGVFTLTQRVIAANFPAWEKVVPKDTPNRAIVQTAALLDGLAKASVQSNPRSKSIKFHFIDGAVKLWAERPDTGESSCQVPVDHSGDTEVIALNGDYIRDLLIDAGTEQVNVRWKDELSQMVFEAVGRDSFTAVVMPMRI